MTTKPYLHRHLESDYDGGDGDGDEEQEPDLVALALGVQAEGQHERDEVAQSLKDRGQGFCLSLRIYSFAGLGSN